MKYKIIGIEHFANKIGPSAKAGDTVGLLIVPVEEIMNDWIDCKKRLPENDLVVETKIDDGDGVRNVQDLKRKNNLWFFSDGSMYVYYTPTHWKSKCT